MPHLSRLSYSFNLPKKKFIEICKQTILKTPKKKDFQIEDKFHYLISTKIFNVGYGKYEDLEIKRKIEKYRSNKLGEFHQLILGSADGWKFRKSGIDLYKKQNGQRFYIEVKNKYNTLNSSSRRDLMRRFRHKLKKYPNCKCYLGIVNSKNGENGIKLIEEGIYEIYGESLYSFVFNDLNAYNNLLKSVESILNNNKLI